MLTLLAFVRWGPRARALWLARCDCGKEKVVAVSDIRNGHTRSCGCLRHKLLVQRMTKHGHSTRAGWSSTYKKWKGMIDRCTHKSFSKWEHYGGRGIRVCKRWRSSFEAFLEDMGEAPTGMSLDRINPDGNYTPGNCRWATQKQQARNKRTSVMVTARGETLCVAEWAERVGICETSIHRRLRKGWSHERAVFTPAKVTRRSLAVRSP